MRIISCGCKAAEKFIPDMKEKLNNGSKCRTIRKERKKPFVVGEKIQIYWKQRMKPVWKKCEKIKMAKNKNELVEIIKYLSENNLRMKKIADDWWYFKQVDGCKKLFDAEITEIKKIQINYNAISERSDDFVGFIQDLNKFVHADGFNSVENFFKYFEKQYPYDYDFVIIKWRRLNE